jgi:hypothetical protein
LLIGSLFAFRRKLLLFAGLDHAPIFFIDFEPLPIYSIFRRCSLAGLCGCLHSLRRGRGRAEHVSNKFDCAGSKVGKFLQRFANGRNALADSVFCELGRNASAGKNVCYLPVNLARGPL